MRATIRIVLLVVLLFVFSTNIGAEPTAKLIFHLPAGQLFSSFGEGCAEELDGESHSCDGIDINHRHYANLRADGAGIGSDWLDHDLIKLYALNVGDEWHPLYEEPFAVVAFLGQFNGDAPTVEVYQSSFLNTMRVGPVVYFTGSNIVQEILNFPADVPEGSSGEDVWKIHILAIVRQIMPDYGY